MLNFYSENTLSVDQRRQFIRHFAGDDNWHELDHQKADFGYGWLHYALIRNLKPKRVLCIGSKQGYIPAICALACRDNEFGQIDFIDAGFDEGNLENQDNHWGGVGFWKTDQGKKHFQKFGLNKYINLIVMTSQDFFKNKSKSRWQYIHLDGDHSYRGVKHDFKKSWPKLDRGGIMALHDIMTPATMGGQAYGSKLLWKELVDSKKYHYFQLPGLCGLGIIQK